METKKEEHESLNQQTAKSSFNLALNDNLHWQWMPQSSNPAIENESHTPTDNRIKVIHTKHSKWFDDIA